MSSVVIYDSVFGNTEQIAAAVAEALRQAGPCTLVRVNAATSADVSAADLVVIGSPTQGFHALPAVSDFIGALPDAVVAGRAFAVFDTRIALEDVPSLPLRWAVKVGGFAAPHLARRLEGRRARLVAEPGAFIVAGREGPLKDGELARAIVWAHQLANEPAPAAAGV
jgi:flavodoxin